MREVVDASVYNVAVQERFQCLHCHIVKPRLQQQWDEHWCVTSLRRDVTSDSWLRPTKSITTCHCAVIYSRLAAMQPF